MSYLRAIPPFGALAFRSAYWLRQTLELQSLRDLRQAQTPNSSRFATYGKLKRSTSRFASLTLRLRTEMLLRNIPVFRMAYFPYLTVFRMRAKQIQRLPLRGAGAKRLKGGPWG